MEDVDLNKFVGDLLSRHPGNVKVKEAVAYACTSQGLEYREGKIVKKPKFTKAFHLSIEDRKVINSIRNALGYLHQTQLKADFSTELGLLDKLEEEL